MKLSIPQPSQGHFVPVSFLSALAVVVDRFKLSLVGGRHAVAFAQVPIETVAQAEIVILRLLDATGEIERRFEHQKDLVNSTPKFFFFLKLVIEVEDKAVKLWVGPKILHKIPTRTRDEVADVINGLMAVIDACEALDEFRLIGQIVARSRAVQASA